MNGESRMSNPKSHHFVPRSYLARFSDNEGFLHVFDRQTRSFRRQRPKEVMTISNYYRQEWASSGVDPNIMEKTLGEWLETDAKESIDRLIHEPSTLTETNTETLLNYLEVQRIRVPRQAEMAKALIRETLLRLAPPEAAAEIRAGRVLLTIKDSARFEFMRTLLGKLQTWFGEMEWEVVRAEDGANFVTTDSPVSLYNLAFRPPAEPGLGLAGTVVFFPLDSRHVLLMRHSEFSTQERVSPLTVLEEPCVENDQNSISISHGLEWNTDFVNDFNRKMVQRGQRFVVAESKEVLEACVSDDSRPLCSG